MNLIALTKLLSELKDIADIDIDTKEEKKEPTVYGTQIVVLDRGWVYIGDVTIEDGWVIIADAKNIRQWGTSKGLGELAENGGPFPNTKLDEYGKVRAPINALVHMIEANEWSM